jgi:hypothetical protein
MPVVFPVAPTRNFTSQQPLHTHAKAVAFVCNAAYQL